MIKLIKKLQKGNIVTLDKDPVKAEEQRTLAEYKYGLERRRFNNEENNLNKTLGYMSAISALAKFPQAMIATAATQPIFSGLSERYLAPSKPLFLSTTGKLLPKTYEAKPFSTYVPKILPKSLERQQPAKTYIRPSQDRTNIKSSNLLGNIEGGAAALSLLSTGAEFIPQLKPYTKLNSILRKVRTGTGVTGTGIDVYQALDDFNNNRWGQGSWNTTTGLLNAWGTLGSLNKLGTRMTKLDEAAQIGSGVADMYDVYNNVNK